ncbi:phosphotransferase enzyme family protein [Leptospira ryugenii]|uniref:Phosphotransferase enzyme family protein n=1 Tax=Leptospira ryugenii TaxID=1917863 RepID=A0A2P2E321_9LEPT|nr:phosphotransferase [Leptospira ryugenii]GBF51270.1 phosphotransferase enzyme family protein [Leptospira ryugenii]
MTLIIEKIQSSIEAMYQTKIELIPLQEEASTRRYYSFVVNGDRQVLCTDQSLNHDFIQLSEFLSLNNVRVPRVLYSNGDLNFIIQSWEGERDLGTFTLQDYIKTLPHVIDLILKLQKLDPPSFVKTRRFDLDKLGFEIQLTEDKFNVFRQIYGIQTEFNTECKAFLQSTIAYLDQHPVNVFTHRDFHSRNILINDKQEMVLIDFQDARMGVPQYDLASILYDAYYPLSVEIRKELLTYFQKKTIGGSNRFKETFYLQALQRSFKALGTYFRMVVDEKKYKFKPSILSCLEQLEEIIQIGLFSDALYIFVRGLRNEITKNDKFQKNIE